MEKYNNKIALWLHTKSSCIQCGWRQNLCLFFFSLLEKWAIAAHLKVCAHACAGSHYCVFIVCLELRGADRQFPAHTTIEQQNFLSVCAISFSEHVVSLYIEQILHRYIPRTSGKPCLHFKVWLQTMEAPQFLAKKSSVKNFRRIFPKNLPQLEILGLKSLDVRGANVVQKKCIQKNLPWLSCIL